MIKFRIEKKAIWRVNLSNEANAANEANAEQACVVMSNGLQRKAKKGQKTKTICSKWPNFGLNFSLNIKFALNFKV